MLSNVSYEEQITTLPDFGKSKFEGGISLNKMFMLIVFHLVN